MNGMFENNEPYAEVQILWHCKETNCPNTLPIVEAYSKGDTCFIVTEHLPGGNLYSGMMELQPNKQMSELISREVFRRVAIGLCGLK